MRKLKTREEKVPPTIKLHWLRRTPLPQPSEKKSPQRGLNCSSVLHFYIRVFFLERAENPHAVLSLGRAFYLVDLFNLY